MKILIVEDDERVRDALEIGIGLQWQDAQVDLPSAACSTSFTCTRFIAA